MAGPSWDRTESSSSRYASIRHLTTSKWLKMAPSSIIFARAAAEGRSGNTRCDSGAGQFDQRAGGTEGSPMVASEREREWSLLRLSLERLFWLVVLATLGSGSEAARVGDVGVAGTGFEGSFAGVLGIEAWEPSVEAGLVGIPVGLTDE